MIRRKPLSIKTRLLLTNIGFVFFAFLWIILIFNILINSYISNSASGSYPKSGFIKHKLLHPQEVPLRT